MATTAALVGGGLALGGAVGGGIAAAQAPGGVSPSDVVRFQTTQPLGAGALGEQTKIQHLISIGAPIEAIIEDFLITRLVASDVPAGGRLALAELGQIKQELARGDINAAKASAASFNRLIGQFGRSGFAGSPGLAKIVDGKLEIELLGAEGKQLTSAIEASQQIFQDRVQGFSNLAGAAAQPIPTREQIAEEEQQQIELQLALLNSSAKERTDAITEKFNQLGINPGAAVGEVEEERLLLEQQVRSSGGLERALALLGGQQALTGQGILNTQAALEQTQFGPAANTLGVNTNVGTQGLALAAQLATASTQAEAARNAGIANAFGNVGGAGLLGASLFGQGGGGAPTQPGGGSGLSAGGGLLTSGNLQQQLGTDPFNLGPLFPGRT